MKTKVKSESKNKPTLVAFLLDRTGSMAECRDETIGGFNGYLKELRGKENSEMRFTLTQFDTISIDVIHDAVPLKSVMELNSRTFEPRGGTPLYDAIGKTIRATEAQAKEKFKVLFVTLTDGEENSSSEWNEKTVQDLIKEKEAENWTFAYIGVGPGGWDATSRVARGTISAANVMKIDPEDTVKAYKRFASVTKCYAASRSAGVTASASGVWKGSKDASEQ